MLEGHPSAVLASLIGRLVLRDVCVHSRPQHGPWCGMMGCVHEEMTLLIVIVVVLVIVLVVGSLKQCNVMA